ncbi:MAG: serine hydrolase [Azoarcus sp.]|jgi:beta-lactamase class A|nr:serine hydrolase [Azoarcus sp.]
MGRYVCARSNGGSSNGRHSKLNRPGWTVADKTGTGAYGTRNDMGILWPPRREPVVLAVYFTRYDPESATDETIIAGVARHVARAFG